MFCLPIVVRIRNAKIKRWSPVTASRNGRKGHTKGFDRGSGGLEMPRTAANLARLCAVVSGRTKRERKLVELLTGTSIDPLLRLFSLGGLSGGNWTSCGRSKAGGWGYGHAETATKREEVSGNTAQLGQPPACRRRAQKDGNAIAEIVVGAVGSHGRTVRTRTGTEPALHAWIKAQGCQAIRKPTLYLITPFPGDPHR